MVKCGQKEALANLLSDVRWALRRFKVGGWLGLKMDFELLFEGGDNADMRQVYEVLKRHWSEISKDARSLTYFIGGSLTRTERENKYTAMYFDSMNKHLSRPFLVPAISANGKLIVSDHDGCTVLQWDAVSGQPVGVRFEAHSEWVSCLAISKDGSTIVTGSKGKTLRLCNAKNG